ncbi:adenylosuccinate synthase [Roseimicrobium gellanilyticum]|uniref:Adenylosuccinate synthetase n=1 Tax=Roseimicrobium gellanilyticum TaxID=748857 RepID=A0A366H2V9_9BACT|nr:adenylosuccinate synthase [Roseimicrobium gellanilyticum]
MLGLGFGDCGKGHFIDALTRRWQAHTVVRFNGGAQAGHNVVTSAEGATPARHHTFSQFGSGTFVSGVHTLLLDPVVVHPTALLVEAEALGRSGVHDALTRLAIDGQCRITTPFHQAANRLRERLRGIAAHGTCGVGVGETVRHSLEYPAQVLRYVDLLPATAVDARSQVDKAQAIRETLLEELLPQCAASNACGLAEELSILQDESLAGRWLNHCRALARQCPPAPAEEIHRQLTQPGCVLFEGAQGVLLDEWRGFHPHTTWSTISTEAVDGVAAHFGLDSPIEHYGVLRSYLTRHGTGPMPTHDSSLDAVLPEPHNHAEGWQGQFRRGHPDAVLLRYALEAVGKLQGLLVGHLDIFQHGVSLKWCERYVTGSAWGSSDLIERLPLSSGQDLEHQSMLTNLMARAEPQYDAKSLNSADALLERITSVARLPIAWCSHGPCSNHVRECR